MYGIPNEIDLSSIAGESMSQLSVGQFDLSFTLGKVIFSVQSPVNLFRNGELLGHWEDGKWPDSSFFDILNTEVARYEIANRKLIVIEFQNGVVMHLEDSSENYESMQISLKDPPSLWII